MVSVNVAQLLQESPGAVRQIDFSEPLADPTRDLRLARRTTGRARLTRTNRGILANVEYATSVRGECARCLDEIAVPIEHAFDEEFVPSLDVRSGLPATQEVDDPDQPRITASHEIYLDDLLRQDILTSLPFRPLCDPDCPGLCVTCGTRLSPGHARHVEEMAAEPESDERQPFARLATLLRDAEQSRDQRRPDDRA